MIIGVNCKKNGVICEGYPPRELWKGGKQRSEEVCKALSHISESLYCGPVYSTDVPTLARRLSSFKIPTGLPALVEGVETEVDRRFLYHFVCDLSRVLTIEDRNSSNPFKDLLLPMAIGHKGLMHSLMALSGTHIIAREPLPEFNERQLYHFDAAVSTLRAGLDPAVSREREGEKSLADDPTVASTIVHCLISICQGSTNGEYRMFMNGARRMILDQESKNPEFQKFIYEFFLYHDVLNSVTSLDRRPIIIDEDDRSLPRFLLKPAVQPGAGVLMGVLDGLFKFITRITGIRDNIRARKVAGLSPTVTYDSLMLAVAIDAGIRDWDPGQEENTPRWVAAQLYRQCTWVYLFRTIQASRPSEKITAAVDGGLDYLQILPPTESTQCILLLPTFILGCAAFNHNQRPPLEKAFDNLQEYSKLGNIKPARQIVRTVWDRMDAGDETSWDWEGIMCSLGMDLLVT